MNPADLFLSPDLTEDQARAYLESLGFRHAAAADAHLQGIADDLAVREALGRLASDLLPSLLESPDPDAAAENLAHYLAARRGRAMFLDYLREDPRALHVLTYVLGASPLLSEILVRTPEHFHWLVAQVDRSAPDRQDHEEELVSVLESVADAGEGLHILRRWKRRETLRIGTRDLLRRETLPGVLAQLSDIACVTVDFALAIVTGKLLDAAGEAKAPGTFAVIAAGALGAGEMDYGSTVELFYLYDAHRAGGAEEFFTHVGCGLTAALAEQSHEGYLYDVRVPSWLSGRGRARALSIGEYREWCASQAGDDVVRCALARARPVAGDAGLGQQFTESTRKFVHGATSAQPAQVGASTVHAEQRDAQIIEQFTHALWPRFGDDRSLTGTPSTLAVLDALGAAGLIDGATVRELHKAYILDRSASLRQQLGVIEKAEHAAMTPERVRRICSDLLRTLGT